MRGFNFHALLIAASAAAAATAWPANAQCRLCTAPLTGREDLNEEDDIRLEIQSTLNFDRVILYGAGEGAAVIRPDGSKNAHGAVSDVGPRAMVGTVNIHGQPGRAIRVELPRRIQLYSMTGSEISLEEVATDLPSVPRLNAAGNLSFRFGGKVRITGDAGGEYRGDLPITVDYQ